MRQLALQDPGQLNPPATDAAAFHRSIPGHAATPLVELPGLAAQLGIGRLLVKDESDRLGLPSFKILGASWAAARAVGEHRGRAIGSWPELLAASADQRLTLVTTSDGNHGWALAKVAHDLGVRCRVHLPDGVGSLARQGIRALGAELVEAGGDYDEVVARTAAGLDPAAGELLVQDTSWAGYATIPRAIVDGYRTLAAEADEQAAAFGTRPELVLVPMGVGCLGQAMVEHFRSPGSDAQVVAVEPAVAACITASLAAGARVTVDTGRATTMAGLRCGTPSADAWPVLAAGLSAGVAITDAESATAAAELAVAGIALGPCGAAPLAGLRALLADPGARDRLGLGPESVVLLIGTEGVAANAGQ
ncbi:diaminopropionate ammonia-lyase [Enemella evansiae]|uniref:diaminopropionate ammonia-lyase n=1 Tax=Enemella evansiae TaxID=2016499 RepID=UPI00105BFF6C|nr:diaminopropionate ammonia-lyase [Enemella evansiae]TDO92758.1 diaminopropionate ammonia-lyase [Enemella evansiae]